MVVGPGGYQGRLPRWAAALARWIGGDRGVRVPWSAVEHVTSRITLNRKAEALGLGAVERRLRPLAAEGPLRMIRSAELQGRRVVAEDGRRLGRVEEIHVRDGAVTVLTLGPGGLLERFRGSSRGQRVAWDEVLRVTPREIVVRRSG